MKRSELFFGLLRVLVDLAALTLAFALAYSLRSESAVLKEPLAAYMQVIYYLLPAWLVLFALTGLYTLASTHKLAKELGRIVLAVAAATMFAIIVGYLTPNPWIKLPFPDPIFPSKYIPLYGLAFGIIAVAAGRLAVTLVQRACFRFDLGVHRIVIIGATVSADYLLHNLSLRHGYKVLAVTDTRTAAGEPLNAEAMLANLDRFKDTGGQIDDIIIADPSLPEGDLEKIIEFAEARHIALKVLPGRFGISAASASVSSLAGLPIIEFARTPLEGWGRIVKRLFDLAVAVCLLVLFAPLLALIALLITLTMPGPILYRQKRLGRFGKEFEVIKFRSMVADADARLGELLASDGAARAEWEATYKLKHDPRVTSFGRFLRKYSLDELPQLINVITGEMSLVGPRPIVPEEHERYGELKHALLVLKPGLTGMWQISGRNDIDYSERVKLDAYYIERWSLALDIVILFKTLRVFAGKSSGY